MGIENAKIKLATVVKVMCAVVTLALTWAAIAYTTETNKHHIQDNTLKIGKMQTKLNTIAVDVGWIRGKMEGKGP